MSNQPSKNVTRWKCVGYCRHCTADEDESTFSREWGHFEKSDDGVWVRADSALAEIARLRAAIKVARQAILEFSHAQESGPNWHTRGTDGMYAQVRLWLRRGQAAAQEALGPYDDNGEFLAEKSPPETAP